MLKDPGELLMLVLQRVRIGPLIQETERKVGTLHTLPDNIAGT